MEGISSTTNTPGASYAGGLTGSATGATPLAGLGIGGMGDTGYGSGGGVVGRVGDYAGDRHANESQGPGLAGIQNFGSMRERNDGRNVEETHNEHKSEHKSEDKSTQNRPHNPTLMPGSESICLEGTDTGPCAGPDCGGGMGCHGYGMEDE